MYVAASEFCRHSLSAGGKSVCNHRTFHTVLLNVYLILTARLSVTSSMRRTCKKHNANVLLFVEIVEGQDNYTNW